MPYEKKELRGRAVLEDLAETYQQLYLAPGEEGMAAYRAVVARGEDAPHKSLSHFLTSPRDISCREETPAGEVRVITLWERKDFETFIQIMTEKCEPKPVPATQGAATLLGVISWPKINQRRKEFFAEAAAAGRREPTEEEWYDEFSRFTQNRENYTDKLIILSVGPYSHISAEKAGFGEEDWIQKSQLIRKYHECTHFFCRKKYPELVDYIWDEVAADAAGLRGALGRYDGRLGELFLGLEGPRYVGGRLENYIPQEVGDREAWLGRTAEKIHRVIGEVQKISNETQGGPFELAEALEKRKKELWG